MRKLNTTVENVDLDSVQELVGWQLLKSGKDLTKSAIRKKKQQIFISEENKKPHLTVIYAKM